MTSTAISSTEAAARRRPTAWLAGFLLLAALGMVAFMVASAMLPGHELLSGGIEDLADLVSLVPTLGAFLALPVIGAVLAIRRPRNPISWLLLVGGLMLILGDFSLAYVERSLVVGPELPATRLLDWLSPAFATLAFPLLATWLPLLFPDGRLPGPRWRPVAVVAGVNTAVAFLVTLLIAQDGDYGRRLPNPTQFGGAAMDVVNATTMVTSTVLLGAAILAGAVRFRRSRGVERQQMKWFVAAVSLLIASMLLLAMLYALTTSEAWVTWTWTLMMLAVALIPIAIGVAILRYRLYDIDRIISRTLGYAIITIILGAIFAALVLGIQTLARPLVGGSQVAVAISTLAVAALFGPVRGRVQRAVDRRFNRSRYNAIQLSELFSARLRDHVELDAVRAELIGTSDAAFQPASISVWVRAPDGRDR